MKHLTEKKIIGNRGEDVACKFLMKQGFKILDRNYLRKWGEIDIVATKDKVHFVEVKTVSRRNLESMDMYSDEYRPEDNVHAAKLQRLARVIQTYIHEHGVEEGAWQFDVVTVYLDLEARKAKVEMLPNVIL
jgi:putative endonuclease